MLTALERIREGMKAGRLCEDERCYRDGPHYPGEFGCYESDVKIYLGPKALSAVAEWTRERLFG